MQFIKSLKFAIKGIVHCINNERNMRIHTVATLYVLLFSRFFNFSPRDYAILALTICVVLMSEMFNTAIERMCDMSSNGYSLIIKIVKDIAAGAVLVSALTALFVAICLFNDINSYIDIYRYFSQNILSFVLLLVSIAISCIYIGFGSSKLKSGYKIVENIKNKEK